MILNIYYIFGLLALLASIINLVRFNKFYYLLEWISKFKKINGNTPNINEFRIENDYNLFVSLSVSKMVFTIWTIFGLFTNNWFIFLSIMLINLIINIIIKKWNLFHKFILFIKSFFEFITVLFLILNNFIWKINLLEFFNNL